MDVGVGRCKVCSIYGVRDLNGLGGNEVWERNFLGREGPSYDRPCASTVVGAEVIVRASKRMTIWVKTAFSPTVSAFEPYFSKSLR